MAYAQLDEHFDEHPKYEDLDLEHFGLLACAISHCNRLLTDGFISTRAVRGFGRSGKGPRVAAKLVEKGIWKAVDGGFDYVGFLDHNPSKKQVLERREESRKRKESYRKTKGDGVGTPSQSIKDLPSVPASVPMGQPAGQPAGQPMGQTLGHPMGQTASGTRDGQWLSRVPRARAPAGAIHSTSLHSTARQNEEPESVFPARPIELNDTRCGVACERFCEAVAAAGRKRHPIRADWERQAVCDALNVHFSDMADLDAAFAAMTEAVADWVAVNDGPRAEYTSGWSPINFGKWLATQGWTSDDDEQPPPRSTPSAVQPRARTPEEQVKDAEMLREFDPVVMAARK